MNEATYEDTPEGRRVTSDGWFVLNLDEAVAMRNEAKGGWFYLFEADDHRFADFGIGVHVVRPGEPSAMYHAESVQEGFLVLSGECLVVVEEEERLLRQWDYFHCPAGVRHITVGAGDGPCAILMVGARREPLELLYPVSEVAARHGASVATETNTGREAYADWPGEFVATKMPWPPA